MFLKSFDGLRGFDGFRVKGLLTVFLVALRCTTADDINPALP